MTEFLNMSVVNDKFSILSLEVKRGKPLLVTDEGRIKDKIFFNRYDEFKFLRQNFFFSRQY